MYPYYYDDSPLRSGRPRKVRNPDLTSDESDITDGSVTTSKIADGAVTEQKLADGSVSLTKMGGTVLNTFARKSDLMNFAPLIVADSNTTAALLDSLGYTCETKTPDVLSQSSIGIAERMLICWMHGTVLEVSHLSYHYDDNTDQMVAFSRGQESTIKGVVGVDSTWTVVDGNDIMIPDSAVTESKIVDNAITTNKIANNSVTADKLSADAIPTMSTSVKGIAKVGAGLSMNGDALELDGSGDIATAVASWLDVHPEATTTVEDNSIGSIKLQNKSVTTEKLSDIVKSKISNPIEILTDGEARISLDGWVNAGISASRTSYDGGSYLYGSAARIVTRKGVKLPYKKVSVVPDGTVATKVGYQELPDDTDTEAPIGGVDQANSLELEINPEHYYRFQFFNPNGISPNSVDSAGTIKGVGPWHFVEEPDFFGSLFSDPAPEVKPYYQYSGSSLNRVKTEPVFAGKGTIVEPILENGSRFCDVYVYDSEAIAVASYTRDVGVDTDHQIYLTRITDDKFIMPVGGWLMFTGGYTSNSPVGDDYGSPCTLHVANTDASASARIDSVESDMAKLSSVATMTLDAKSQHQYSGTSLNRVKSVPFYAPAGTLIKFTGAGKYKVGVNGFGTKEYADVAYALDFGNQVQNITYTDAWHDTDIVVPIDCWCMVTMRLYSDSTSIDMDADDAMSYVSVYAKKGETVDRHSVVERNYDQLDAMRQARKTTGTNPVLGILHFSDVHGTRVGVRDVIGFASDSRVAVDDIICTGDIITNRFSDSMDFWDEAGADSILTVIGNHDALAATSGYDWTDKITEQQGYDKFIAPYKANWNAATVSGRCYYHKDYEASKVRLIVLDGMIASESEQGTWLSQRLSEAKELGYSVVAANHFPPANHVKVDSSFTATVRDISANDLKLSDLYLGIVQDFIDGGGKFMCWLCGHTHTDYVIKSQNYPDQIFLVVGNQSFNSENVDYLKVRYERSEDGFNMVYFDTNRNLVKVVRIGATTNMLLMSRRVMAIDCTTRQVIYSD